MTEKYIELMHNQMLKIRVPRVPNYILIDSAKEDDKVDIAELSTEVLNSIADEWRKEFLRKAKERKRTPEPF